MGMSWVNQMNKGHETLIFNKTHQHYIMPVNETQECLKLWNLNSTIWLELHVMLWYTAIQCPYLFPRWHSFSHSSQNPLCTFQNCTFVSCFGWWLCRRLFQAQDCTKFLQFGWTCGRWFASSRPETRRRVCTVYLHLKTVRNLIR